MTCNTIACSDSLECLHRIVISKGRKPAPDLRWSSCPRSYEASLPFHCYLPPFCCLNKRVSTTEVRTHQIQLEVRTSKHLSLPLWLWWSQPSFTIPAHSIVFLYYHLRLDSFNIWAVLNSLMPGNAYLYYSCSHIHLSPWFERRWGRYTFGRPRIVWCW